MAFNAVAWAGLMIPNPWIILGFVGLLGAATAGAYLKGHTNGYAEKAAEYAKAEQEKVDAARDVERRSARCAADPSCILPDPWRR
jgi:hypothetical protein